MNKILLVIAVALCAACGVSHEPPAQAHYLVETEPAVVMPDPETFYELLPVTDLPENDFVILCGDYFQEATDGRNTLVGFIYALSPSQTGQLVFLPRSMRLVRDDSLAVPRARIDMLSSPMVEVKMSKQSYDAAPCLRKTVLESPKGKPIPPKAPDFEAIKKLAQDA